MFFHSIQQIFHLNSNLSFVRLIFDKRMLQKLIGVWTLMIILHQNGFDEIFEFWIPSFGFESWRGISWNQKECPHWMHVAKRRLGFGHFQGCDTQTPQVRSVIVGCIWVFVTSNDLYFKKKLRYKKYYQGPLILIFFSHLKIKYKTCAAAVIKLRFFSNVWWLHYPLSSGSLTIFILSHIV